MARDRLIEFDQDLCDYILGQIRPSLRLLSQRPVAHAPLDYDQWQRLDIATWLGRGTLGLPARLADALWACPHEEIVPHALDDAELSALVSLVEDPPLFSEDDAIWLPYPALHNQWVELLPDIQRAISRTVASEWAENSVAFATRLNQEQLSLADGISIVQEWLWCLRRLNNVLQRLEEPESSNKLDKLPSTYEVAPQTKNPGLPCVTPEKSKKETDEANVCGWQEVMQITGLKKTKIYELFHQGTLKGYRDGKMIRFYRSGLAGYMHDRENRVTPPLNTTRPPRKTQPKSVNRFKFL